MSVREKVLLETLRSGSQESEVWATRRAWAAFLLYHFGGVADAPEQASGLAIAETPAAGSGPSARLNIYPFPVGDRP